MRMCTIKWLTFKMRIIFKEALLMKLNRKCPEKLIWILHLIIISLSIKIKMKSIFLSAVSMRKQRLFNIIKLIILITFKNKINLIFRYKMNNLISMNIKISKIMYKVKVLLTKWTNMIWKRKRKECSKLNCRNRYLQEVEL
jgi:hypothetical protein